MKSNIVLQDVLAKINGSRILRKEDLSKALEDVNEIVSEVVDFAEKCEKRVLTAEKQVAEWNKDEEIQKLQEKIAELKKKPEGMSFYISAEEKQAINEWIDQHINEKHNGDHYAGAIGGRFTYKFIPTSIGDIGEIVCSCGDKFCFREL